MGWVTVTFRDGRPPLYYGDDNPHRPRQGGPKERAAAGAPEPREKRWVDPHDDPEISEPGGNPYR